MRKLIAAALFVGLSAVAALAQSQQAPTLRIVSEDGNRLPSDLMYGNTKVKPMRLRPGTNVPITIDDSDFFVQQQYVDFLSRFPDQSGFAFWQDQINNCSPKPSCVEVSRVNTSGAFFLSIEFENTGLFVIKSYRAAFGNISASVPVPVRRETFMPETRGLANGVIVGVGQWEKQLDDNKNAYALAFVQRADFVAKYPTSLGAAAYVDALFATSGVTPTASERNAAVAAFGSGGVAGRAAALRSVVESGSLHSAERNRAFVLLQYFGYLKRNPDDAPEDKRNFDGF
ncbi:MAG TPA: hypothetical protein VM936_07620, partial [Pyrinomonadaceae bacterium]|nr:hypothetical protein [Pyrinomonadaceae bacterium]